LGAQHDCEQGWEQDLEGTCAKIMLREGAFDPGEGNANVVLSRDYQVTFFFDDSSRTVYQTQ